VSQDNLEIGEYVRFRHLPKDCEPKPLRVRDVLPNGMVLLDQWTGQFRMDLFVRVPAPLAKLTVEKLMTDAVRRRDELDVFVRLLTDKLRE
jgi:hypothetical protein